MSIPVAPSATGFYQGANMEFDDDFEVRELDGVTMDFEAIRKAVLDVIKAVGEDPDREGLINTPDRVSRMYAELLSGYSADPAKIINGALFNVDYDEMVLVRDIEFYSLCEHHMLPFLGRAHVAYLPKGRVIGLSKIPRIVDMYARRLQVQERMTRQIADLIQQTLQPNGVAVVVEAVHLCSMMRGVKKHDARMTTSAMHGAFRANLATRQEFLENIARPRVEGFI
jgi:GTP cyclohydrolase I